MSDKTKSIYTYVYYGLIFLALLYCVWIVVDDYQLAQIGYPSAFDYQNFDLSSWIKIIIIGILITYLIAFQKKEAKGYFSLKNFLLVLFFMVSFFDDWINEYRYYFSLYEIKTIQIDATLDERVYLKTHPNSNFIYPTNIEFKEFPNNHFTFNGKPKLRKVINTVKNDTLFIDKGTPVKIRLRSTDYDRILNGEFRTSISPRRRIEGTIVQIYELEHKGKIIYRYFGIE